MVAPGFVVTSDVLARSTVPEEPGRDSAGATQAALEHAWWVMGLTDEYHEQHLNPYTALAFTAVWRCVTLISQTIASLGWHIYERQEDGRTKIPILDVNAWLLNVQASDEMTAFEWRQVMLRDALLWGNGYTEIERDGFGRIVWLYRIAPDRVEVTRSESGRLIYVVENGTGLRPTVLSPDRVFHLKGPGPDGLVGYSMIELFRRALQLGLSEEKYGSKFFERGPMPGGVLKMPGNAKKEERQETRASFEAAYGGAKNAGRVVVVSGGMEFTPLTMPNTDVQFLESRRFQVEEVCRIFGVPPHKVFDLTRSTNNNIEHQSIEWVQDGLLPWARRLESEADVKLFGRVNRGKRYTRLNLNTLLRGDSNTQTTNLATQLTHGLLTVNEGREYLDLNPIDGGDTPLIQGAMVPLERILEEPEPEPAPAVPMPEPTEEEEDESDEDMPEAVVAAFRPLLVDLYGRLLRVDADKAKRAANKGQLAAHVTSWYGPDGEKRVAEQLAPTFRALLAALARDTGAAEQLAGEAAVLHCRGTRLDLRRLEDAGTAEREADEALGLLGTVGAKPPVPSFVIQLPEQPAPVVNVQNLVEAPDPKPRKTRTEVLRDESGRIIGKVEEELPC